MRELEQHFRKSAELCNKLELREGEAHGVSGKRRKLAHAAIGTPGRSGLEIENQVSLWSNEHTTHILCTQ